MEFLLPDLGGAIVALVLLILALALGALADWLVSTFAHTPVIGGFVSRDLAGWVRDAANGVIRARNATWHFAAGMFNWASDALVKPLTYVTQFAVRVWEGYETLRYVTIPHWIAEARSWAVSAEQSAVAHADSLVAAAERDIDAAVAAVQRDAAAEFRAAETYAAGLVTAAERTLAADVAAAERAAAAGLTSAEHALSAGIAAVSSAATSDLDALARSASGDVAELARDIEQTAQSVAAGAAAALAAVQGGIYTDLEQWGDAAVSAAWPDAVRDIDALRGVIGSDFPDISGLLGALGGLGAAGLLGALIRSLAGTAAVTELAEQCIIPNCRNLSQFGRDLQGLLGDVPSAALLAWIVFLVADPSGWAQDTYDAGGPLSRDFTAAAARLLGAA